MHINAGSSWSSSHGSWIYNYLCNQSLSLLSLWVRTPLMVRRTRYKTMWYNFSVTGRWFSPNTPVSSTNKADRHDITEILLKLALDTTTFPNINNLVFGEVYNHTTICDQVCFNDMCQVSGFHRFPNRFCGVMGVRRVWRYQTGNHNP